jgi:hypothetical protein
MKKLLCLFSASLLVLTSCSKDDDNTPDPATSILAKTVKNTNPSYPSENSSSTVIYNGNKIVSIKEESRRVDYTYDGNVIIKTTSYDIESGKDVKSFEISYTYANNKLAAYSYAENFTTQFPTGEYKGRSVFTHNSDGTVKRESYSTNSTTGVETKDSYIYVSTFVNGNLVKEVGTDGIPGSKSVRTDVYEYDSKNNPLKNVLGFNLLLDNDGMSSVNNVVRHTSTEVYGSSTYGPDVYKTDYVYDANGYPTKGTVYKKDGTTVDEINEYTY